MKPFVFSVLAYLVFVHQAEAQEPLKVTGRALGKILDEYFDVTSNLQRMGKQTGFIRFGEYHGLHLTYNDPAKRPSHWTHQNYVRVMIPFVYRAEPEALDALIFRPDDLMYGEEGRDVSIVSGEDIFVIPETEFDSADGKISMVIPFESFQTFIDSCLYQWEDVMWENENMSVKKTFEMPRQKGMKQYKVHVTYSERGILFNEGLVGLVTDVQGRINDRIILSDVFIDAKNKILTSRDKEIVNVGWLRPLAV